MLKKTLLASAVALFAVGSFSAIADTDLGLITFDGAVTDTTCNISTSNGESQNNITITLPVVKKSEVESTTIDTGVGSKNFELLLTNCPETLKNASASFMSKNMGAIANGTIEPDANVQGSATNVALALFNNAPTVSSRIMVGQPDNNTQKTDLKAGSGKLFYRVAYVPGSNWVKDTSPVQSGKVSANAYFTMSYE
ncbi:MULTISPECIES: fimbrial protein [Enterobacter]|jgi:major type 1 subunit fimbrin (pilin)|uniref:Fimbrial protein n=3 Tax=Enterobacter TaxID=547 RepID=A0ABU9PD88_9ENTR|nr:MULTISPECIES: fimbrial protein [Enterobacter]KZR32054.1 fimbrial protein [Enterobacter genomosp. S]MBZ6367908.1 fimbrial protein [Enterobacter bugandensis]MCK6698897.1 fimbrial protein [Enterobacter bugandensis]MCK6739555.1 fimbrial protein [Enterobacter bugandensis]MCK6752471.1 fimbrial protein [Enterobacter bugandensis]